MRTTIDIDDDVLMAAKELAKSAGKTAGKIISEMVRKAMTTVPTYAVEQPKSIYGIRPFPKLPGGKTVTSDDVRRLMDDEGI